MHTVPVTAAIEKDGKFLLVKRSEKEANYPGKWIFPGGKVEKGEDALQGLLREIKEETGLEVQDKAAMIRTYHFTRSDGGNALGFNFVLQWKAGEVVLGDGLTDYSWILPEDIVKYDTIKGFETMLKTAKEIVDKGLLFPISRLSHGVNLENNFYVKDCDIGKGIFASRNIKSGEEILRFSGPIINFERAVAKGEKMGNPLQIDHDKYIDTQPPALFINHSCDPNSGIKNNLILFATKDISKDDEIKYDYSATMDEDYWTLACKCKSKNCRGIIKDFKYLPKELQEKYLNLGIVQEFIYKQYQVAVQK